MDYLDRLRELQRGIRAQEIREPADTDKLMSYKLRAEKLAPSEPTLYANNRIQGNPYSLDWSSLQNAVSNVSTKVGNYVKSKKLYGNPEEYEDAKKKKEEAESEAGEIDPTEVSFEDSGISIKDPDGGPDYGISKIILGDSLTEGIDKDQKKAELEKEAAKQEKRMEENAGLLRKIQEIENLQASNAQEEAAKQSALKMLRKAELDFMGDMSMEKYKQEQLNRRNTEDNETDKYIQRLKNKKDQYTGGSGWTDAKAKAYVRGEYGADMDKTKAYIDIALYKLKHGRASRSDSKRKEVEAKLENLYDQLEDLESKAAKDLVEMGYLSPTKQLGSLSDLNSESDGQSTNNQSLPQLLDAQGNPVDGSGLAPMNNDQASDDRPQQGNPSTPQNAGEWINSLDSGMSPNAVMDAIDQNFSDIPEEQKIQIYGEWVKSRSQGSQDQNTNNPAQDSDGPGQSSNTSEGKPDEISRTINAYRSMSGEKTETDPFRQAIARKMDNKKITGQIRQSLQTVLDNREKLISRYRKIQNEISRLGRGDRVTEGLKELIEEKQGQLQEIENNIDQLSEGVVLSLERA